MIPLEREIQAVHNVVAIVCQHGLRDRIDLPRRNLLIPGHIAEGIQQVAVAPHRLGKFPHAPAAELRIFRVPLKTREPCQNPFRHHTEHAILVNVVVEPLLRD